MLSLRTRDWLDLTASALVLVVAMWFISTLSANHNPPSYDRVPPAHEKHNGYGADEYGAIEAAGAFLSGIFTIILAISTIALWSETRRIGDQQANDTRILQRAYISVEPAGIEPYADGSARLSPNVLIYNAGNLPASSVEWRVHWQFAHTADYEPTFIDKPLGGSIVLPPKGEALKGDGSGIPISDFVTWTLDDANWLFIWGKVTYKDGFRGGRFTKFCHRYYLAKPPVFLTPGSTSMDRIDKNQSRHHEYANGTDEKQNAGLSEPT